MPSPSQVHAKRNALTYQTTAALQSAAARACMVLFAEASTHQQQAKALNGFDFYTDEAAVAARTAREHLFRLIGNGVAA